MGRQRQEGTSMAEFYPRGRLTLTSGKPVMTSDVTAATNVYYAPYVGDIIPLYNGTSYGNSTFTGLTAALNSTSQAANNLYDLFAFLNNSVLTIGFGPSWSSGTGGSNTARGSGAGSTEITQVAGLWLNVNTMTLNNGATTYSSIA